MCLSLCHTLLPVTVSLFSVTVSEVSTSTSPTERKKLTQKTPETETPRDDSRRNHDCPRDTRTTPAPQSSEKLSSQLGGCLSIPGVSNQMDCATQTRHKAKGSITAVILDQLLTRWFLNPVQLFKRGFPSEVHERSPDRPSRTAGFFFILTFPAKSEAALRFSLMPSSFRTWIILHWKPISTSQHLRSTFRRCSVVRDLAIRSQLLPEKLQAGSFASVSLSGWT